MKLLIIFFSIEVQWFKNEPYTSHLWKLVKSTWNVKFKQLPLRQEDCQYALAVFHIYLGLMNSRVAGRSRSFYDICFPLKCDLVQMLYFEGSPRLKNSYQISKVAWTSCRSFKFCKISERMFITHIVLKVFLFTFQLRNGRKQLLNRY